MFCKKCGAQVKENAKFCGKCGAAVEAVFGGKEPENLTTGDVSVNISPKKAGSKKKVTGAVIAMFVLAVAALTVAAYPRELTLNGGDPLELYVDDFADISISGEGLTPEDYDMAVWSTDDEDVLCIDEGLVEAYYDKYFFETNEGECFCTGTVYASIQKGIRTWKGSVTVTASLMPVEFESGEIILEPADSKDSHITVIPSDTHDVLFYLESQTDSTNDIAFVIKKGVETKVSVPRDEYIIYTARGETWYGEDYLFGSHTSYEKDVGVTDFIDASWRYTIGVADGNVDSDHIGSEEFPEL